MLKLTLVLLNVLSSQIFAAPYNTYTDQEIEKDVRLDDKPYDSEITIDLQSTSFIGKKRMFDFIGFNTNLASFLLVIPLITNNARENAVHKIIEEQQFHSNDIIRGIKNIADATKRQQGSPLNQPHLHLPAYFPHLFIPRSGCGCGTRHTTESEVDVTTPAPTPSSTSSASPEGTVINLDNRTGVSENSENTTNISDYSNAEDGVRPISFDTTPHKTPPSVSVPPVEHGSIQAGATVPP